ncbi:MAG: chemotaxis protein CheA [Gammaproteobacteria bacterium]|nr:chemotaxis protein CheA [Gammaproteobacteria bacterium]
MAMDMEQFHQTFFEESLEGLDLMESALLNLDVGAAEPEAINSIFRAAHSIKGGSGTFGFLDIANFTHLMETLLDEMRDGRRQVVQAEADLLLRAVDGLRMLVAAAQGAAEVDDDVITGLQAELQAALEQGPGAVTRSAAGTPSPGEQKTVAGWHIRFRPDLDMMRTGNDPLRILRELAGLGEIQVAADSERLPDWALLDPEVCYLAWDIELRGEIPRDQVDEVFAWVADEAELDIQPLASAVQATVEENEPGMVVDGELLVERRRKERRGSGERRGGAGSVETTSIRVSIDKIDDLINMVGELVITQSMLGQIGDSLGQDNAQAKLEKLRDGLTALERNTRELQESVMRIRMLPISFAFNRFPRLVHDLGGKLGKQIDLRMSGENTELDKTVMEKIGDPLVHLVRNALDHGLETPEVRLAAGKTATGTLLLNAYHQGGNIVIEISDDGAGINRRKVLAKAVERGLLSEAEASSLPDDKVCDLIFQPGFSTADVVSDVSGRGVGMDVVRRNIQDVGGSVELSSQEGQGSRITIRLPLTLAILDGQLVRVGGVIYIIPLVSIIESLQAKPESINAVAGKAEVYRSRDEYLPVIRLHHVFNIEADTEDLTKGLLVVAEGDGQKAGIFVDELLGQQQVVIKSLESNYRRVDGVSGATILGDGSVALIMDIPGLIRMTTSPVHDVERKRA